MSSFKIYGFFVYNSPETEAKRCYTHAPEREPVLRRIRITPLGFCLTVIVNENPLYLEKTTCSFLSVNVNLSMALTT